MAYDPNTAQAAADFAQYAPNTGTWREAASNLLGVCNDALETGRKLKADAQQVVDAYAAAAAQLEQINAGATAGRDLAQKIVDTWGAR